MRGYVGVRVGFYIQTVSRTHSINQTKSHTFIPNDHHLPASVRNAQGMVLHARTAANISQNEDLHAGLGLLRSMLRVRCGRGTWLILGWKKQDKYGNRGGQAEGDVEDRVNHGIEGM